MKYRIRIMIAVALLIVMIPVAAYAQTTKYTVVKGDSLWKIAVKFQVGLSEIISANPQFKNPNLIYPGDIVYVPQQTKYTSEVNEVIRLVNQLNIFVFLHYAYTGYDLVAFSRQTF